MADKPIEPRNNNERVLYDTLETRGLASVKADLSERRWGTRTRAVKEWVNLKEGAAAEDATGLELRSVEAAERAASAAERSARWAMCAAVIAAVALVVAVWPHVFK